MKCETQGTINRWAEITFGPIDARGAFLRCAEEFAELARALGFDNTAAELRGAIMMDRGDMPTVELTAVDRGRSRDECADVLITLYRVFGALSQNVDHDIHDAVDAKMLVNHRRKWLITGAGVGQHIKDDK